MQSDSWCCYCGRLMEWAKLYSINGQKASLDYGFNSKKGTNFNSSGNSGSKLFLFHKKIINFDLNLKFGMNNSKISQHGGQIWDSSKCRCFLLRQKNFWSKFSFQRKSVLFFFFELAHTFHPLTLANWGPASLALLGPLALPWITLFRQGEAHGPKLRRAP